MRKRILLISTILIMTLVLIFACGRRGQGNLFKQQSPKQLAAEEENASDEAASASGTEEKEGSQEQVSGILSTEQEQSLEGLLEEAELNPEVMAAEAEQGSGEASTEKKPSNNYSGGEVSKSDEDAYIDRDAVIEVEAMTKEQREQLFYYVEIPEEVKLRINGKSYGEDCTIPYEELRYVRVLHWGFDKKTHLGEMIVNKAIAQDVVDIFKELYEIKYPIEKMVLVDEYDADDNKSMADNNTSAFNFRMIDGTDKISQHGYGVAIDINPLYNPYVRKVNKKTVVTPKNGKKYADRSLDCEYYIQKDDPCYKAFISRGFTWGGEWKSSKDYQHFEKQIDR